MTASRSLLARIAASFVILVVVVSAETIGANAAGLPLPIGLDAAVGVLLVLLGLTLSVHTVDRLVPIGGSGRFGLWYGLAAGVWFLHAYRLDLLHTPAAWFVPIVLLLVPRLPVPAPVHAEPPTVFLVAAVVSPDWMVPWTSPAGSLLQSPGLTGLLAVGAVVGAVVLVRLIHHGLRAGPGTRRARLLVSTLLAAGLIVFTVGHGIWTQTGAGRSSDFRGTLPTPSRVETDGERKLPNIILISIDTLRWDAVPPHAPDKLSLPALERLRRDSLIFPDHFATSSVTHTSHASLFSGLLPVRHTSQRGPKMDSDVWLYPQILRELGYRTAGFTGGGWVQKELGFGRGYDRYWEYPEQYRELVPGALQLYEWVMFGLGRPYHLRVRERGVTGRYLRDFAHTVDRTLSWLNSRDVGPGEPPFFLFLHTYHAHHYKRIYPKALARLRENYPEFRERPPTAELRNRFIGLAKTYPRFLHLLYDHTVEQVDRELKRFLDELQRRGLYDDSLIVFYSDHGEGFLHTSTARSHGDGQLHEVLIRTPLFIKLPGNERGGRRIRGLVQSTDVFPSIFQHLGIRPTVPAVTAPDTPQRSLLEEDPSLSRELVRGSVRVNSESERNIYVRSRSHKYTGHNQGEHREAFRVTADTPSQRSIPPEMLPEDQKSRLRKEMLELLSLHVETSDTAMIREGELSDPLRRELEGMGYL